VTRATTAALPPLVVWLGEAMFTFAPGRDITVGRGKEANIRVDIAEKQAIPGSTWSCAPTPPSGWRSTKAATGSTSTASGRALCRSTMTRVSPSAPRMGQR
jgi:hypothetical protein